MDNTQTRVLSVIGGARFEESSSLDNEQFDDFNDTWWNTFLFKWIRDDESSANMCTSAERQIGQNGPC